MLRAAAAAAGRGMVPAAALLVLALLVCAVPHVTAAVNTYTVTDPTGAHDRGIHVCGGTALPPGAARCATRRAWP
jgi:hypothetical protein